MKNSNSDTSSCHSINDLGTVLESRNTHYTISLHSSKLRAWPTCQYCIQLCCFSYQLVCDSGSLKSAQVKSTNLAFLEAVLLSAEQEKDVIAVFKPFCFLGFYSEELIVVVDVIADGGYCWIKVTARNASALHLTWQGISLQNDNLYIHTYARVTYAILFVKTIYFLLKSFCTTVILASSQC